MIIFITIILRFLNTNSTKTELNLIKFTNKIKAACIMCMSC